MENKIPIWKRAARFARRLYHTVNNYSQMSKDIDFRAFGKLEYDPITTDEVKDLKKLDYIKRLNLAKKGYIDGNLKKLLAQGKEKELLVNHDHKILPIGNFRILESDSLLCTIKFGFQFNTQTFFMASTTHGNIPLWKTYDGRGLRQSVSALHPVEKSSLRFEHSFYGADRLQNERKDSRSIAAFYNDAVQLTFQSNPYFKESILLPSEQVVSDPIQYVGKQFHLSEFEGKYNIMTLTEATERYLVFQSFLETAPKSESHYFGMQEFKERFLDSKIELIAYLKHGLQLGIHKGILYVRRNEEVNGHSRLQWETYKKLMQSKEISAQKRLYLSKEVIVKKNFVVEKEAIMLKNNERTAFLKKHYGTGEWRFAEGEKNQEEMNFRPIVGSVLRHIDRNYSHSKNFPIALVKLKNNLAVQTVQMKPS
ncbi:hypothetical protein PY092_10360 [Muricauda sp. 334s03]|uniref:DUF2971 domain-containing protein n=1 Tax=Flagellimonas yonaguniensis TaxID=3031325 RepID=A0ABT5XZD5_9FLAO|nr:hypothetical protein [[Muricauda] yonaguniensis]MDF0716551.1 hypothetical protein [[Muricauda] yonaguniensis]